MTESHDAVDLKEFRREVRAFIRANLPDEIRDKVRRGCALKKDEYRTWERILAAQGWLVPHWPKEWGGLAWSSDQKMVLDEEKCINDCPELVNFPYEMVGPMLMRYGSEEQKHYYLPRIAHVEDWWCQGYSEPNAGSDLASLQTSAVLHGDHYIVNGSKIWTSHAQYANRMFALVRTSTEGKQQEGITFLFIDMTAPGVSLRPIIGIHGWHMFNQIFFDNVKVPVEDRIGNENQGWTIAKSVLESERLNLARVAENHRRLRRLQWIASQVREGGQPLLERDWFRNRLGELEVRLMALEASVARFRQQVKVGGRLGAEVGRLKLRGSQLIQDFENLTVDAVGPQSLAFDPEAHHGPAEDELTPWYAATASSRRFVSRGYTIAGGSSEVQHISLAKQVLGL